MNVMRIMEDVLIYAVIQLVAMGVHVVLDIHLILIIMLVMVSTVYWDIFESLYFFAKLLLCRFRELIFSRYRPSSLTTPNNLLLIIG